MWTEQTPLRALVRRVGVGALALSLCVPAWPLDRSQHTGYAECTAGDCRNGHGTILRADLGKAYTGQWSGGRFVDGMYEVQYAGVPGTFPMRYGADGLPKEGTMAFSNGTDAVFSKVVKFDTFTGTFGPPPETFVTEGNQLLYMFRKQGSTLRKGRYVDGYGFAYEGEFEYIPLVRKANSQFGVVTLARGVYVFLGARIDEALQEVETGVFVSQEIGPDMATTFSPASPSYLAKLQAELIAARSDIQREKAEAARASRENWNMFLGVLAGVAVVAIANKAASSAPSSSISGLKDVLRGSESPNAVAQRLQSAGGAPAAKPGAVMALADYKRIREGGNASASASSSAAAPAGTQAAQRTAQAAQVPAAQAAPAAAAQPPSQPAAGRRTVNGTMYISAYAVLANNRSNSRDLILEASIVPVAWTYGLANARDSDLAKITSAPWPIPENLEKEVIRGFRDYVRNDYEACNSPATPKRATEGCYGISTYFVHGTSEAEVRQKISRQLSGSSRKRVSASGFAFPRSASHAE